MLSSFLSRCFLRWAVLAALTLVLGGWTGNVQAAASCGHYVKRLGPGFVPERKPTTDQQSASQKSVADQTPSEPHGCHGAECHGAPYAPLPSNPQVPPRSQQRQELVGIGDEAAWQLDSHARFADESSPRASAGYPQRQNRPPAV
ncbi:MAG: hypothetical protein WD872_09505 [Pirellulaceae bacterium]